MKLLKIFMLMIVVNIATYSFAAPNFPELSGRVVDQMNVLSAEQQQELTVQLAAFEQQSTAQIVVAVVSSLEGYEIRDYGFQLGRHWGIGQKDKNNGVLLLIAPNERKVSIEVGYGLEGSLTDALSSMIIQQDILPEFKLGDMPSGIMIGVTQILQALSGEITEESQALLSKNDDGFDWALLVFAIMILLIIIFIVRASMTTISSGWGSTTGTGSSSGYGSGSSFGGGFSGGGGSFGGGGASGGW